MQENWNLDNLYESHKSENFLNDMKDFSLKVSEINSWCLENFKNIDNAKEKLEEYINKVNNMSIFSNLSSYISLMLSTDTTNTELLNISSKLENINTDYQKQSIEFISFLKKISNLDDIISSSNILKKHAFILKENKEESNYLLSKEEENTISKMSLNGSNMWTKQWSQLTSTLEVNYKDKILTLPEVRNLAYDENKKVRKEAYYAELDSYEKIALPSTFSLNGIKGEVIEICKMKGYNSPLEMTLKRSRLDKEVFDAMFCAIDETLPKLQEYFIKKAQLLGHKNSLPFYDLFAPIGKINIRFSYDDAKEFVFNNFSKFSEKLGNFAKTAFDNNWIDVYSKKGKVGGAFCHGLQNIKQSRILMNFSGSLNDVLTLAHELGHGYHNVCLYDETYLNSNYSMPIAETASTLCETIIINSALENASKEEQINILENDLSGTIQCIVDIYSRFLFEDEVFKRRKEGLISKEELCTIMEDSQKKAYGNSLNPHYLHKYMWICKPHYYYADTNYYNFPYAYGTLFSKGLFSIYLKDKENFLKNYDEMLSITGKNSLYEVGKFIGVDVKSKEFWISSLNLIIDDIKKYCEF